MSARVLVTGSAGAIGRVVCRELTARGHVVRGFDRVINPDVPDSIVADLGDAEGLRRAAVGMQAVVHLAATPNENDFLTNILPNNVVGTYHVMEAAKLAGARRFVLASTCQTIMGLRQWRKSTIYLGDGVAPKNFYGMSKAWCETMLQTYATRGELAGFAVRISWFVRNLKELELMKQYKAQDVYISHRDMARFFALCVEAPDPPADPAPFAVLYANGKSATGLVTYDLEPARRLIGFEPRDAFPEGSDFETDFA